MRDKLYIIILGEYNIEKKIFHYNDIIIKTHPEVYDPAEDTFQLIESIKIRSNEKIFEIGTGCGIIALECARLGANVVCSDINPYAIELTKENFNRNKSRLSGGFEIRYGDLFSVLKNDEKFDVIIFNPPYLPISDIDSFDKFDWIDISTNGGKDGLKLIRLFLNGLKKYLKNNGRAYFVSSSLSDKEKLNKCIIKNKLKSETISICNCNDEIIEVYCVRDILLYDS